MLACVCIHVLHVCFRYNIKTLYMFLKLSTSEKITCFSKEWIKCISTFFIFKKISIKQKWPWTGGYSQCQDLVWWWDCEAQDQFNKDGPGGHIHMYSYKSCWFCWMFSFCNCGRWEAFCVDVTLMFLSVIYFSALFMLSQVNSHELK